MPRDAVLLSPASVALVHVAEAAVSVDPQLLVRSLFDRAVLQLAGPSGEPVVSIQNSVLLGDSNELVRLLPDAPKVTTPVWWTEAVLPWGENGEVGKQVLYALAQATDAVLVIEDAS